VLNIYLKRGDNEMGGFMGLLGLILFIFIIYLAYKQIQFIIKAVPLYEEMVSNLKSINSDIADIKSSINQKKLT
jgi:hypothetical protein